MISTLEKMSLLEQCPCLQWKWLINVRTPGLCAYRLAQGPYINLIIPIHPSIASGSLYTFGIMRPVCFSLANRASPKSARFGSLLVKGIARVA